MREYFGTTHFYRLKRKERCFTPEDQLYVRDLLRQYNIEEEPLFDRYEENFGWERWGNKFSCDGKFIFTVGERMKIFSVSEETRFLV